MDWVGVQGYLDFVHSLEGCSGRLCSAGTHACAWACRSVGTSFRVVKLLTETFGRLERCVRVTLLMMLYVEAVDLCTPHAS